MEMIFGSIIHYIQTGYLSWIPKQLLHMGRENSIFLSCFLIVVYFEENQISVSFADCTFPKTTFFR